MNPLMATAASLSYLFYDCYPSFVENDVSTDQVVESFSKIDLSGQMKTALKRAGYEVPTPVQAGFIPVALDEKDVVGQAQTGTGKTAAFAIPVVELLDVDTRSKKPQSLILVPTRELAIQVSDEVEKLSYGLNISTVSVYGGMPIKRQMSRLKAGAHVVVGTPGRVLDHLSRKTLVLDELDCVVLDEADRMLDIGFRPDIERILKQCPRERQTLLLSATMPAPVRRLAEKYMSNPEFLDFSPVGEISVETIRQLYYTVHQPHKYSLLTWLIEKEDPKQAIIFCRTRRGAERLYQKLSKEFDSVGCMHGELSQRDRNRHMLAFREERLRMMVATDVIGRGIDVSSVSHIFNFDMPSDCDDYVHRVGRTGRMGRDGIAFTFVNPDEGELLTKIEMRIDRLLERQDLPEFMAVKEPADEEKRDIPALMTRGRSKKKYRKW